MVAVGIHTSYFTQPFPPQLHMLGDGSCRGATLESCLAKLQHCSPHTQLVGMSATLGNMAEVAAFLRAQVFSSDFRPVSTVLYCIDHGAWSGGQCVIFLRTCTMQVSTDYALLCLH